MHSTDLANRAAIRLERVSFQANCTPIISDLNLTVETGEFVILLGPNGAGKTTVLKIINGLLKPTTGRVELFGNRLNGVSARSLIRKVAYLPQDMPVDSRIPISVRDVVGIGRLAYMGLLGRPGRVDDKVIRHAMDLVGVGGLARRPFGNLSTGQKQKVSLARALAQGAEVMLLDEPMNNLDPQAQQDICSTIDMIYETTGVTILLVTHLLERIPRAATGALLLRQGTVAGRVPIEEIHSEGIRRQLYGSAQAEGP
jgi:ABC-type cobalamin/Fe3+-siderophores transport system ATPase subunit